MTQVPASSHGGGGLSWPGLTLDADGNAVLAPADALLSLSEFHIVAPANSNDALTVTDAAHPTQFAGGIDPFGGFAGASIQVQATSNTIPLVVDGANRLTSRDLAQFAFSNAVVARISNNGHFYISKNSVPADGDISAGEVALWFDKTNAAAKLMLKGKTTDGTVVTASVALA